jgi:hypothetical protein
MGQFTNQPDFAVRAKSVAPSDDIIPENFLNKAALFIGGSGTSLDKGKLTVRMQNFNGEPEDFTFEGLQGGTFLPICVDYVLKTGTTVEKIIAYW